MSYAGKTLQTNILDQKMMNAPQKILSAIEQASQKSGVDFSYLVKQAKAESSFNPNVKSSNSSATGLFQFIDSTWLDMVNKYGDQYGIDTQGKTKQQILDMRQDPESASFMAAAFASENEKFLNATWGGDVGSTELYFAHFLGASGASAFLNARDENPIQNAADIFPRAARANRNVFYDSQTGRARSLEEVYQFFNQKFQPAEAEENQLTYLAAAPKATLDEAEKQNGAVTISNLYANNPVVKRSNAMRAARELNGYAQLRTLDLLNAPATKNHLTAPTQTQTAKTSNSLHKSHDRSPFYSLMAQPVEVMMLTQSTSPSKVIRDKA